MTVVDLTRPARRPTGRLNREAPERMSVEAMQFEIAWLRDEVDRLTRLVAEDTCRLLQLERELSEQARSSRCRELSAGQVAA